MSCLAEHCLKLCYDAAAATSRGAIQIRLGAHFWNFVVNPERREPFVQFTRVIGRSEKMEVWSASGPSLSFVISHESRDGPGFRGRTGFMASWRPLHEDIRASEVGGA